MRLGSLLLIAWLVIGGFAAGQRGDFKHLGDCSGAATTAVTVVAGPLNYVHVDPHITCNTPKPSN
jgi:hypothetical protein